MEEFDNPSSEDREKQKATAAVPISGSSRSESASVASERFEARIHEKLSASTTQSLSMKRPPPAADGKPEDDDFHLTSKPLSMKASDDDLDERGQERESHLQFRPSDDAMDVSPLQLQHLKETSFSTDNDNYIEGHTTDIAMTKRQIMESRATARSNNTTIVASSIQVGGASGSSRSSSNRTARNLQSNNYLGGPQQIDSSGSHPSIPILEATLVEEQKTETEHVYDAVAIYDDGTNDDNPRSWLRRHQRGIFVLLVAIIIVLVVVVVLLVGNDSAPPPLPQSTNNVTATNGGSTADLVNNSSSPPMQSPTGETMSTSPSITPTNSPTHTPRLCARLIKTIPFYYARVAIDKDTAVITNNPGQQHEVHFFTFTDDGLLEPEAYFSTDHLVFDVAISGNTTVVGDPVSNNYMGAVNVFERNTTTGKWFQFTRFEAEDNDIPELRFGYRVDIDRDTLAVGANNDGVGIGPAYVYRKDYAFEWSNEGIINHGDNTASVSVLGDTLAVSTYRDEGTVYIFKFDTQSKTWKKLSRDLTNTGDCPGWFGGGSSAVTDSGSVLVGCGRRHSLTHNGIIYYYVQSEIIGEYYLQQRIEIKEVNGTHVLGDMIAVDGDTMVVGGDYGNDVIIFTRNRIDDKWSESNKIRAPEGSNRNSFGMEVALSGNKILVSSWENVFFFLLENC